MQKTHTCQDDNSSLPLNLATSLEVTSGFTGGAETQNGTGWLRWPGGRVGLQPVPRPCATDRAVPSPGTCGPPGLRGPSGLSSPFL